ncbi:MAG: carboxymuconolactone decarboxylase family protein [Actinomycetota bacterium]
MSTRLDYAHHAPEAYRAMAGLNRYLVDCSLEAPLRYLVELRISQINGCVYCMDMHSQQARSVGVSQQKLDCLPGWSEVTFYSERERAALGWAEAVTRVSEDFVPDAAFEAVRPHFNDRELSDLTFLIANMNAWNRVAVSLRKLPEVR